MEWRPLRDELARELAEALGSAAALEESPLGKALARLDELNSNGADEVRDLETFRLDQVRRWLRDVRSRRPDVHRSLVRQLRRAGAQPTFYGFQFELYVAAKLVNANTPFDKSESPDFQIRETTPQVGIECLSLRSSIDWPTLHSMQQAIEGVIRAPPRVQRGAFHTILGKLREKSDKPYASKAVALAVDVTNLAHAELQHLGGHSVLVRLKSEAAGASELRFGSVLFFTTVASALADGRTHLGRILLREDSADAAPGLVETLDNVFPIVEHRQLGPVIAIPPES